MPIKLDKKQQITEANLKSAAARAKVFFKTDHPTLEMVTGLLEHVDAYVLERDKVEAIDELNYAMRLACELFNVNPPGVLGVAAPMTPEMLFATYELIFGDDD